MPEKANVSDRDKTLINILRRMADQIQKQDELLQDIVKRQGEFARAFDNAEFQRGATQGAADFASDKVLEALSRYRSNMLSLVNEQDSINNNLKELDKLVHKAAYSVAEVSQTLSELEESAKKQEKAFSEHSEHTLKQAGIFTDERLKKQEKTIQDHFAHALKQAETFTDERLARSEKTVHDHYSHSLKQAELIQGEFAETNRNFTKLHAETENSIGKMQFDSQRQMEKTQAEMMRRLLTLDSLESALQTLLIRTEPPEKKPFVLFRVFIKAKNFLKIKLYKLFKK